MNKQELIESIIHLPSDCSRPRPMIDKLTTLELIKLLDEPQKVQVPQVVDGYIKHAKEVGWYLLEAMKNVPYEDNAEFRKWFYKDNNVEVFARAWLDGYEVEKEKRYLVKVKGVYLNSCLVFDKGNKKWFFSSIYETDHQIGHHTRNELEKAGFGEVFNSPLFEVKEVEGEM